MHGSVASVVSVRLVYLARLREAFGRAGETLDIAADEAVTVGRVVDMLRARGDAYAAELAPGRAVRFAVNHRLARRDQPVRDGDEVAILPPVTGG